MGLGDRGDIKSDKAQRRSADSCSRSIYSSIFLIFGMVLLGTLGAYTLNSLPWINWENQDRAQWRLQAYVCAGYSILTAGAVVSGSLADRFTQRYPFLNLWWRLAIAGISMAAATGLILVFLILPMFLFFVGIVWEHPLPMWTINSILAVAWYAAVLEHRAGVTQREQALRVQLDTEALGTTLDRAELSMLEAQIEPHFLFNTLAHVKRHYRIDPATADKMLGALIDYLHRALPALRRADWTIGDELALIRAYIDILIDRFGSRLRLVITASDESHHILIPALTVATLVENAVRHGIAPQIEGGTINVFVEVDSAMLRIDVRDDGVGLKASTGTGLGLVTTRARLQGAFGAQVVFTVEPLNPKGVCASIITALEATRCKSR